MRDSQHDHLALARLWIATSNFVTFVTLIKVSMIVHTQFRNVFVQPYEGVMVNYEMFQSSKDYPILACQSFHSKCSITYKVGMVCITKILVKML